MKIISWLIVKELIKRFLDLDENSIKDGDVILLNQFDGENEGEE